MRFLKEPWYEITPPSAHLAKKQPLTRSHRVAGDLDEAIAPQRAQVGAEGTTASNNR
jgi:hypothetical protein